MESLWEHLVPCYSIYSGGSAIQYYADGEYIYTQQGRLLDLNGGYWTVILGHKRKDISDTMREGFFAHPYGEMNLKAIELAEALCKRTGYYKALFATSGTDAIDSAVRMAWQCSISKNPKKKNVLAIKHGFHGTSGIALAASGFSYRRKWIPVNFATDIVGPWVTNSSWELECARKKLISEKIDWHLLSAFIFEPVLGVGGVRALNPNAYQAIAEKCKEGGALLIADEVTTGVGRTGNFLASERFSTRPDIVCLGKAITNGEFPLSVVLISKEVWSRIESSSSKDLEKYLYGYTYGGHPAGCLAAKKVIELVDKKMLKTVSEKGCWFLSELQNTLSAKSSVRDVRGVGLMIGIELESSIMAEHTYNMLVENGVRVGQEGRVLTIFPPFTISYASLTSALNKISACIKD